MGRSRQREVMRKAGYLAAPVVAEAVGLNVTSIYRMVQADKIEGLRLGRAWFIKIDSLLTFYDGTPLAIAIEELNK